jgi:N4-gp56 family major capsid protein
MKETYFMPRFANDKGTTIVHTKRQLEKQKGETINFALRLRLDKDFIVDGQSEGNEYKMTTNTHSMTLHKYRMPIRDNGELVRIRPPWDVTDEQRQAVVESASEAMDKLIFTSLLTSPTRVVYSADGATPLVTTTAATAKLALTTASLLFPKLISFARTGALTGWNRVDIPLRPVRTEGRNWLILLVHPDVLFDLENNAVWTQAAREARERGKTNPIFTNSSYIWGNVVVHEHENIEIGTDAGAAANVPWAKCVVMGAQAMLWAWGRRPKLVTRDFDYGDEIGMDWSTIASASKPVFDSKDYGSLGFYVARTQVSDA